MPKLDPYSEFTGRIEARASPPAGKGFDGPIHHSRDVHVLLSVLLRRAGVFAGLDSESESIPTDPPARRRGGFFVFARIPRGDAQTNQHAAFAPPHAGEESSR